MVKVTTNKICPGSIPTDKTPATFAGESDDKIENPPISSNKEKQFTFTGESKF
jgi:hypothetical protein